MDTGKMPVKDSILAEFGQRVKTLRKARGLTQEKLAALEVEIRELFPPAAKFKEYSLAEKVADYLKTKKVQEIEKADRLVRTALEK